MSDIRSGRLSADQYQTNFDDLVPNLNAQEALVEASRCYFCYDAPCMEACPTSIDIPSFIRKIQTGNLKGSAQTILSANIMGGTCARVCPTEVLCEEVCVRQAGENKPVKIGQLQRHAVDWLFDQGIQPFKSAPSTGKRIGVIGAGPAGLACAHGLALQGHAVVVFEKRAKAGGLNEFGIAAYKMAHEFAQREVDFITAIDGIEIRYQTSVNAGDIVNEFDAVFVACGLADTNSLGIDGEDLEGVVDAVQFIADLRQTSKPQVPIGRRVVVIGGGNTAIDASIQAKRLGADEVTLVYRRGAENMSATEHEQELAKANGVVVRHWAKPVGLIGSGGKIVDVEFERTGGDLLGERFTLGADQVMKAIGQKLHDSGYELSGNKIKVDAEGRTSHPKIWAGGDATPGDDLTVVAVEDGKVAAASIDRFVRG